MSVSNTGPAAKLSTVQKPVDDAPVTPERFSLDSTDLSQARSGEFRDAPPEAGPFVAVTSSSLPRRSSSSDDGYPVDSRPGAAGVGSVDPRQAANAALRGTAIAFIMALSKPDDMDREVHGPKLATASEHARDAIHKAVAAGISPAAAVAAFKAEAAKFAATLDVKALHRTEGGLEWLEKHLSKDPVSRQLGKAVIELDLLGLWEAKKNSGRKDNPTLKDKLLVPTRAFKQGFRDAGAKLQQSTVQKKEAQAQANEALVKKALLPALKIALEAPQETLAATMSQHFVETLEALIIPDRSGNSQAEMYAGLASDVLFGQDRKTLEAFADALATVQVDGGGGPKMALVNAFAETVNSLLELGVQSEVQRPAFAQIQSRARALVMGLTTSALSPESAGDVEDIISGIEVEITKLVALGALPGDVIEAFKEGFDAVLARATAKDVKNAVLAASQLEQYKSDMHRSPANRLIAEHVLRTLDQFDNKNNERAPARQALANERYLATPPTRIVDKVGAGLVSAARGFKGGVRTVKVEAARSDDLSEFHRSQAEVAIASLVNALDNPDEGKPEYARATFNRALGGGIWATADDDAAMSVPALKDRLEEALLTVPVGNVARVAEMLLATAPDRAMKNERLDALQAALVTTLAMYPEHGSLSIALRGTSVTGNN